MAAGRWADTEEDRTADEKNRKDKEEKKRKRAEKAQRQADEEASRRQEEEVAGARAAAEQENSADTANKRRKISPLPEQESRASASQPRKLLRFPQSQWSPSRHVSNFERLNHIEEGSYGWVSRAREIGTGELVALKKLKMDGNETTGFPVTGLREIQCLMEARHKHIVDLREIVVGDGLDDVYLVMDFLEHDLKTLQEEMQEPFVPSEIKTLLT